MNIIVTVDSNYAIGYRGQPLLSIPAVTKSMMQEIYGKVIVYSSKMLKLLPGKAPITECKNFIMSRNNDLKVKGATVVGSMEEILSILKEYPSEDIYILGGGEIFEEFLPYCDTIHMTRVDYTYTADTYFKNLEESDEFILTADSDEQYCFDMVYSFLKYERK